MPGRRGLQDRPEVLMCGRLGRSARRFVPTRGALRRRKTWRWPRSSCGSAPGQNLTTFRKLTSHPNRIAPTARVAGWVIWPWASGGYCVLSARVTASSLGELDPAERPARADLRPLRPGHQPGRGSGDQPEAPQRLRPRVAADRSRGCGGSSRLPAGARANRRR
jgi:hypothetical protein